MKTVTGTRRSGWDCPQGQVEHLVPVVPSGQPPQAVRFYKHPYRKHRYRLHVAARKVVTESASTFAIPKLSPRSAILVRTSIIRPRLVEAAEHREGQRAMHVEAMVMDAACTLLVQPREEV